VASKRFPLGNERLARFRFARVYSRDAADGTGGPERICEADQVSRELKGEG
jgi:hypothetical protein